MSLDVDEMIRLSRVGEIQLAPDGTWVAVVVQRLSADGGAYVSDLWRVPVNGGAAAPLTRGDTKDTTPRFRRDGRLAFLSNRNPRAGEPEPGDDQRMQVWLLPELGEPVPVTDEPLGVTDFAWAGDDLVLLAEVLSGVEVGDMRKAHADRAKHGPSAIHYRRRAQLRHWQEWLPDTAMHLVHRAADGTRRDLTPAARHELRGHLVDQHLAISPDATRVAVIWSHTGDHRVPETSIRVVQLATGAFVDHGAAPMVMFAHPRWSPDGTAVAAVRAEMRAKLGDKLTLWRFAGADRTGAAVAPDWDTHPQLHGYTPDGARLVCTADFESTTPVYLVTIATGAVDRVTSAASAGSHDQVHVVRRGPAPPSDRPVLGAEGPASPSQGDAAAVCVRSTLLHPPEVFVVDLAADETPRALAALSGFPRERGAALVDVEDHWCPGDGGERVQYLVIKPRGVARPPVLLWIHGGPVGQDTDGWHWRWNPLVAASAGYAVVLPNPRGSTGRGQRFIDGVYGNAWGGACYRDLIAVADQVAARPDVDGARMVAMGGSFGGYMANWIGGQDHRFRAIVSHAGIFHFGAFHGTTDYPGFMTLEMGGPPWDDAVDYRKYSPDVYAGRWKTPALIIHGEKDYRVPISEALLLYEALDARGVDVELLAFPDEGHWITRPRNIVAWYRTWLDFVGRKLA